MEKKLYNSGVVQTSMQVEMNSITPYDQLGAVMKKKVPEGAIYFEGVVSDGEKNRNGYIIDPSAWFFDKKKYVKDFLATGSILYNHNSDMPIGRPLSFELGDNGLINVSGYVFDDYYTNGAIGRGLILGLSTGHYTHERIWRELDTGAELSDNEFWKLPWSEISTKNWCMVVTKAEICEFSFVTVRSNRASVLVNEVAARFDKDPTEVEHLFFNPNFMGKTAEELEAEKNLNNGSAAPGAGNGGDTPTPEQIGEQNKVLTDENAVLKSENDTLKAKIAEMETNHAAALDSQKNELQKSFDAKLVEETNKIRTTVKDELAAAVRGNGTEKSEVKTPEDFKNKYNPKK